MTALVSIDGPTGGPDVSELRASLPYLLVTGDCECGCPSLFLRDRRQRRDPTGDGCFHFSNAVTPDGAIGVFLLLKDDRPWSLDVMLPPGIDPSSAAAHPNPRTLVVTSPYAT